MVYLYWKKPGYLESLTNSWLIWWTFTDFGADASLMFINGVGFYKIFGSFGKHNLENGGSLIRTLAITNI